MTEPNYINYPGNFVFEPPYELNGTDLFGLPIKGEQKTIQSFVDKFFAPILAGSDISYKSLGPFVLLGLSFSKHATSLDSEARKTGFMPENDWAFWLPLIRYEGGQPKRLVWFMPYVFVNSPIAMACGRESFGFLKNSALFTPNEAPEDPTDFSLTAWAFKEFGIDQEAAEQEIFSLKSTQNPVSWAEALFDDLMGAEQTFEEIVNQGINDPIALIKALLSDLIKGEVPMVFLKEFRSVKEPKGACYQAIAEAPAKITKLNPLTDISPITKIFNLHNPELASYPFAESFGIEKGVQPIGPGIQVKMDFVMEMGEVIKRRGKQKPQKVAVLGGGLGSLTTLAAIVTAPEWDNQYEFTVYERSWRLGGKGASGRNAQEKQAIEEHGLHIWLGFYNNAFHLINGAYRATLERLGYGNLGLTYKDFYTPTDLVVFQENLKDYLDIDAPKGANGYDWKPFPVNFPKNAEEPGTPDLLAGPIDYAEMMVEALLEVLQNVQESLTGEADSEDQGFLGRLQDFTQGMVGAKLVQELDQGLSDLLAGLQKASKIIDQNTGGEVTDIETLIEEILGEILKVIDRIQNAVGVLIKPLLLKWDLLRHFWLMMDFGLAILTGMCVDKIFTRGFRVINDMNFKDWLRKHGADVFTIKGPMLQTIYDIVFGYQDGDPDRPVFAAGVGLFGSLRMLLTYKGNIFWRMNMGMGDVIFTPFYEVLSAKGVKFKLFQEIEEIELSADGTAIEGLKMANLIKLKAGVTEYNPFVTLPYHVPGKNLTIDWPCWPSDINWDQIDPTQAARLQKAWTDQHQNLESNWLDWDDQKERYQLKLGVDFDRVICGITPAALRPISGQLAARIPDWTPMLDSLKTTLTRCSELWFKKSLKELGFNPGSKLYENMEPIVGGYQEPYSSTADLSHLLPQEEWSGPDKPKYLAYPCSTIDTRIIAPSGQLPPPTDHSFPKIAFDKFMANNQEWLNKWAAHLWPKAANPDGTFDQNSLAFEYWRVGINYTEHYVLTAPGTPHLRRGPNDFGIANFFIAGDWTQNLINAGCVEGGVISGLNCARFFTNWPIPIYNATKEDLIHGP